MIDQAFIHMISGHGGNGIVSGRHEKFVPRGGPDGGDGGRGGDIIIIADRNVNTLLEFRYRRRFKAYAGGRGEGANKHGKNGGDVRIRVPVGTQVWEADTDNLFADLSSQGQGIIVAKGGRGGRGNARFATSTNQYPLLAEEGEAGEELSIRLELKLLADVGIIGLPNAGKSSLLASVSAARPKVADYPFTTLEPVLGVVERFHDTFVMVDIPGLIEGASEGIGLGHDFLRHIERTRVLVHVVDGSALDPLGDLRTINRELVQFNEELAGKPQLIAINKLDIAEVRELRGDLEALFAGQGGPVFFISAATHDGVDDLLNKVYEVLQETRVNDETGVAEVDMDSLPVLRPRPRREPINIRKLRDAFVVEAPRVARIAAMLDEQDWNARIQFLGHLQRTGVVKALEDAGIMPGDTVRFGSVEWEWE